MNKEQMKLIGQMIRSGRLNKNLTLPQLANAVNSSKSTIQRIESGETQIPDYLIQPICNSLGIDPKFVTFMELDRLSKSIQPLTEISDDIRNDLEDLLESAQKIKAQVESKKRKILKQLTTAIIIVIAVFATVNIVSYALTKMFFFEWISSDKIIIQESGKESGIDVIPSSELVEIGMSNDLIVEVSESQTTTIDDLKQKMGQIYLPSVLPDGYDVVSASFKEIESYKEANVSYLGTDGVLRVTITEKGDMNGTKIYSVEKDSAEKIVDVKTDDFSTTVYILQGDFSFAFAKIDNLEYQFRYTVDLDSFINIVKNLR